MLCFRELLVPKKIVDKRRSIKIFRRIFFVSQCRKVSKGNPSLLSSRNYTVAKKIMDEGGRRVKISLENLLSHSAEKLRRGTLLCCVSENSR